MAKMNICIRQA